MDLYKDLFSRPTQGDSMGLGSPKIPDEFNWISMIDALANGDITKYEYIYNMKYEECLFNLLYNHHKDRYTNELNRRAALQNRTR